MLVSPFIRIHFALGVFELKESLPTCLRETYSAVDFAALHPGSIIAKLIVAKGRVVVTCPLLPPRAAHQVELEFVRGSICCTPLSCGTIAFFFRPISIRNYFRVNDLGGLSGHQDYQ